LNGFNLFINDVVLKKITRQELLVNLQLNHVEFCKLDAITLSRWSNGVTTPSYLKQLLIAHTTDTVQEFLGYTQSIVLPIAFRRNYAQFVGQFNSPYHSIHLSGEHSTQTVVLKNFSMIDSKSLIGKRIKDLNQRYLVNDRFALLRTLPTELLKVSADDGCVESFLTIYSSRSLLSEYLTKRYGLGKISRKKALCVGFTYFRNSEDYSSLCSDLVNKLLSRDIEQEYIFFFVRGVKSMTWFEYIGAKQHDVISRSKDFGNLYLYGMDLKNFTGNPLYLSLASKRT